jgi:neurotransmitter:Na+ symporter, NSS family
MEQNTNIVKLSIIVALLDTVIALVVGIVSLLSNIENYSEILKFGSKGLFDWMDYISSAILLPLGGIITAVFVGFFIDQNQLKINMLKFMPEFIYTIWLFSIRFIVPLGVGIVMIEKLGFIKF